MQGAWVWSLVWKDSTYHGATEPVDHNYWALEPVLCNRRSPYTIQRPLESKEIQAVSPKGNQSWIFIGRTDAEAEAPLLWPPDVKSWLIGKDPDAGKTEGKRRRGWQMMRWLDSITDSMKMNLSKLWETVKDREGWHAAVHEVTKSWTWFCNSTYNASVVYMY